MTADLKQVTIVLTLVCCFCVSRTRADQKQPENGKAEDSWMTFLSRRTGRNVLYKMRPEGSDVTPIFGAEIRGVPILVEGVTLYREPHWTRLSPNRKYFASWAIDQGYPIPEYQGSARYMIYVGSLDGDWTRVLTPDGDENFAWSPDSTRIAFTIPSGRENDQGYLRARIRSTEIVVVGIDGSNYDYVLEQPGLWTVEDWSPDGKRLLLRQDSTAGWEDRIDDLVEFDLAAALAAREKQYRKPIEYRGAEWPVTGARRYLKMLLPGSSTVSPSSGRYSPDGKYVAVEYYDPAHIYSQRDPKTGASTYLGKLGVLDIATGEMTTFAEYPEGLRGPICWSPDGKEVLFSRYLPLEDDREKREEGRHGLAIWAVSADGRKARFVTTGWSPDWR
jgi:hypothetical protein